MTSRFALVFDLKFFQVYAYLKRFGYTVRRAQGLPGYSEYGIYRHPLPVNTFVNYLKMKLVKLWNLATGILRVNWWTRFHPGLVSYFRGNVHYRMCYSYLSIGNRLIFSNSILIPIISRDTPVYTCSIPLTTANYELQGVLPRLEA